MSMDRLLHLMSLAVVASPLAAATINVPGDHLTIQAAINVAVAGDLILVAPGNYPEQIDFLGKAVHVRSTSGATLTTIQAGGLGPVVSAVTGETSATQLEGFTLDGGDAVQGGGVYIDGASPTITDCVIQNCLASFGGGACTQGGNPLFHWCRFENNIAANGAGLFVNGNATIDDCDFVDNKALSSGGAIMHEDGFLVARKCLIENNEAGNNAQDQGSGGAICALESTIDMDDMIFKNNFAWIAGGIWSYRCSMDISNSDFEGNEAELDGGSVMAWYGSHRYLGCSVRDGRARDGAGFMHQHSLVTVLDCEFRTNAATGQGGAFCGVDLELASRLDTSSVVGNTAESGAGMMLVRAPAFNLNFNVFTDNHATLDGGGVHAEWSSFNSNQCGFLGNTAGRHGGGLSLVDSDGQFQEWQAGQNDAGDDGGAVHALRGSQYFFSADFQSNDADEGAGVACRDCDVTVSGSQVRINTASVAGGGFHIVAPGLLQIGGSTVCGNLPNQIVGPFQEFAPNFIGPECSDCEGDVDADAFIGVDDLLAVINAWGACGGCPEDVNGDGVVGIMDLLTVLENWGWCQ